MSCIGPLNKPGGEKQNFDFTLLSEQPTTSGVSSEVEEYSW